jgi:hypothetical protein
MIKGQCLLEASVISRSSKIKHALRSSSGKMDTNNHAAHNHNCTHESEEEAKDRLMRVAHRIILDPCIEYKDNDYDWACLKALKMKDMEHYCEFGDMFWASMDKDLYRKDKSYDLMLHFVGYVRHNLSLWCMPWNCCDQGCMPHLSEEYILQLIDSNQFGSEQRRDLFTKPMLVSTLPFACISHYSRAYLN